MSDTFPITFDAPVSGVLALLAAIGTVALVALRRPAVPTASLLWAGGGVLLLVFAAAGLTWNLPQPRPVAVLVDLSPSTRTADYRDSAHFQRRVRELLGNRPHELRFFADGWGGGDIASSALPDLAAARTVLPEVDAPAVVLFSDGRGRFPATLPPAYCVIDGALDEVADAAVTALDSRGGVTTVGVRNEGGERLLVLRGMGAPETAPTPRGAFSMTRRTSPGATSLSAGLAPGDAWPENDTLRATPPPGAVAQRWWVGASDPPGAEWTAFNPGDLPGEVSRYLDAAVIVLDNVPADAFDAARLDALGRYVRELGGSVVILGGDRAFAAGGYAGTRLDEMSPLASAPPEPTTHWLLLADASGSMNQSAAGTGRTRWQFAAGAVTAVARQLPPADLASVGSFAQDLRWWAQGRPVAEVSALPLPPEDVRPRGPTNLDVTLRRIAEGPDAAMPKQLLLATDAYAEIADPEALGTRLAARRVRLHLLHIGEPDAEGLPALRTLVAATGGSIRSERLPENWVTGLRELMRAAQPPRVQREAVAVNFAGELKTAGAAAAELWNRTWPRDGASPLASAEVAGERLTMAARWNVGLGQVAAAAFPAPPTAAGALADLVARPPRDPRFRVSLETSGQLRVNVEAAEGARLLNGEELALELRPAAPAAVPAVHPIPQAGPGRYELVLESPRQPVIATVRRGRRVLETAAVAERYAAEFDVVGNDRAALADLARRTGGAVVEPGVTRRLELPASRRPAPLVPYLATGGAALVAAGLLRWRWGT
jgi:hypothetical protein